jgi:hypothetical protein
MPGMRSAVSLQRRFPRTLPDGGAELSPSGGARAGSGRIKGKKTSDTIQITARVKRKTAGKLRAAAKRQLQKERRLRPRLKRPSVGKILDELAKQL